MNNKKDQKTLNRCMKMIDLLRKKGRLKAFELAKELDLNNTRSIYYYKKIISTLGYNIKSTGGYEGGYELITVEKLSEDDLNYLKIKLSEDNFGKMKLSEKDRKLLEKIKKINEEIK